MATIAISVSVSVPNGIQFSQIRDANVLVASPIDTCTCTLLIYHPFVYMPEEMIQATQKYCPLPEVCHVRLIWTLPTKMNGWAGLYHTLMSSYRVGSSSAKQQRKFHSERPLGVPAASWVRWVYTTESNHQSTALSSNFVTQVQQGQTPSLIKALATGYRCSQVLDKGDSKIGICNFLSRDCKHVFRHHAMPC